ncbi:MAG: ABC transporter permease [Alphaproteobacteria bacterium]|nr:ABC transporter permease [Alphaproteobacteria bacterium]
MTGLRLERRGEPSLAMMLLSPVIAVALMLAVSAAIFSLLGKDPAQALFVYFVEPLTQDWSLQELVVKAAPLVLIAVGLACCYLSNNWNIGAEGQYVIGGIAGGGVALLFQQTGSPLGVPAVILAGALGGALFALIPAVLKVRFGTNEILTSLMLVYIAEFLLDYLVRGPWRDPKALNFPQTVTFDVAIPILIEGSRVHLGALFALAAVALGTVLLSRTLKGFEIRVLGQAPRAALFAGFSPVRTTLFVFALSGALAGLAGVCEVAGSMNQLRPAISPGYGFAAIIVAFLGRLNPIGILFAGLLLALSYLGGENAQIMMKIPLNLTRVLQGLLLFFVLACDLLILYRVRVVRAARLAG